MKVKFKEIEGEKYFKFDSKFDEKKYYYGNILMAITLIFLICFMAFVMYYVVTNKDAFAENPFVWGAEKIGGASCTCQSSEGKWFNFDEKGFYNEQLDIIDLPVLQP